MAHRHGRVTGCGPAGQAQLPQGLGSALRRGVGVGGHRHSQTILVTNQGSKSTWSGTREPESPPH